jgi:hypothetical protein
MNPRLAFATALTSVSLWSGCSGVDEPMASPSADPAPSPSLPAELQPVAGSVIPGPPKPSLSRLTDKNRPKLEFFGATIYADSISEAGAKGNVFVDGTELHRAQRSFPIAVYADEVRLDLINGEAILSGWPIVQTDSAYVQGQSAGTVIQLSQNQVSAITGPAKYVLGDKATELFEP